MEQKLTNEEIAKVFAMYIGCDMDNNGMKLRLTGVNMPTNTYKCLAMCYDLQRNIENCKLLITPLSAITDEHAVEVAKIICDRQYIDIENLSTSWERTIKNDSNIFRICFDAYQITRFPHDKPRKHIIHITTWGTVNHYIENELGNCTKAHYVFQYLISKGYAVPLFFGIDHWANGKTAIELGIAIDNTKNVEK